MAFERTRAQLIAGLGLAVGLVAWPGSPPRAENLVLEEVIVTARKRSEKLQETPVAVTALDAQALRETGIRNLANLNQMVPNIEVSTANGNAPAANIYIRGVGQRNTGLNIDSGVGIYLDGVYLARPDGALLDIVDMQSVQVLRGPQGTLFGKNTTAGALVFTTNKPVDNFEAELGTRVGNYDRLDGSGMLNVPLTDTLWTRFSGAYRSADGYIKNDYDGKEYMNEHRRNLIWQTRWAPSGDWLVDLNLNYAKTNQRARPQKCLPVPGYQGWQAELLNTLAITPNTGRTLGDYCQDAVEAGGGDSLTVVSDLGGKYKVTNQGASLTADWDYSEHLSVKSITAWRYTGAQQDDELDSTGIPFLHRTMTVHPTYDDPAKTDQYSQEFQFTGDAFGQRLHYVTGLYWFNEQSNGDIQIGYLGPWDPAISNLFFLNATGTDLDTDNTAAAAFAQAEWEFTPSLRGTVGLRYTDEERKLDRRRYSPVPGSLDLSGGQVTAVGEGVYVVQRPGFAYNADFQMEEYQRSRRKLHDNDYSPMASLQYLMDDVSWLDMGNVYLTYAQGFLSGGISEAPSGELEDYKPEEVESWELGFKLEMLGRRLRVNGDFYYTDYHNRQLTTVVIDPVSGNPAPDTINAEESTITGFELETTWLAMENLTLTFNMTLNDGDIDKFEDVQLTLASGAAPAPGCVRQDLTVLEIDACPNDRSDESLPRLPKQTYFVAAEYAWPVPVGTVTPRLQASWKRDIEYCFDSASCRSGLWREGNQFDLSARLNWASPDEKWFAALYGDNLTDEDYMVGGTALVDSSGVGGYSVATPRTYGVELQYRF